LLESFQRTLLDCWVKLRHPLAKTPIRDDEPLTHFLFSRGTEYSVTNGTPRLKAAGLMPFKYVELSVFRVQNLPESLIWRMGDVFVGLERKKKPTAKAAVTPATVSAAGLVLVVDHKPARHANISGWPATKHDQLAVAQKLILAGAPIEARQAEAT
jgi:hypothetical protein